MGTHLQWALKLPPSVVAPGILPKRQFPQCLFRRWLMHPQPAARYECGHTATIPGGRRPGLSFDADQGTYTVR